MTYTPTPNTSVSTGTLRTEDLLTAFAAEYRRFEGTSEHLLGEANAFIELLKGDPDDGATVETAVEVVDALTDALNDLAPAGCYFGSHEGDGADFGYWSCEEDTEAPPVRPDTVSQYIWDTLFHDQQAWLAEHEEEHAEALRKACDVTTQLCDQLTEAVRIALKDPATTIREWLAELLAPPTPTPTTLAFASWLEEHYRLDTPVTLVERGHLIEDFQRHCRVEAAQDRLGRPLTAAEYGAYRA